ncbi:50S ribosomal protein L11 [Firmicutes bacterium CAG:475]|jgi:ribosomal protein L11|nr:50S ribosomal protein L11 [Clostridia bacterium]MBS5850941.1 50S ribosomal protein L11 [Bacillota bacterium]CDD69305.1 50S ribosomal protein L11 [Firmicutes bacterium CAG:475]HAT83511.1 50S ribosomal protein L11 [Clostridiales bacterium]HBP52657.1 50S ribosomal protein L11 [Clostridiales bacterium]
MAKKITAVVKLQLPAGKATPGPPVGSTLGPHGINIAGFTKEFNEKTSKDVGLIIPVIITIYQDHSFTFVLKTPPAPVLIKKACGLQSASAVPNKTKVATLTKEQLREIATQKMPDLNAANIDTAMSMIAGTARSMGVLVEE